MTAIKICGLTRAADVEAAVDLGVQALGFVLWPGSPRAVGRAEAATLVRTLPPLVSAVAVLVEPTVDEVRTVLADGFTTVQVHGTTVDWAAIRTAAPRALRAVHLAEGPDGIAPAVEPGAPVLLDAHDPVRHGGSGRVVDWARAAAVAAGRRVILAGGLTPENVDEAIRVVQPYGVDVASGVETRPGVKDASRMRAFVAAVRAAGARSDM